MAESPQENTPAPTRSRFVPLLLVLLVAIGLFVAVFVYVGGVEGVTQLLSGTTPEASGPTTTTPVASTTATDLAAAKLIYAEQIESQDNIDMLADGDVTSFTVDSVIKNDSAAIVKITASFKDGTQAPGALRFVRSGDRWYFTTITGLAPDDATGMAAFTNSAEAIEATATPEERLAAVGVKEPDAAVLKTLAEQQIVNQPIVRDLIGGEYKWYRLAKPVAGPGTFTIPVTFGGSAESTGSASIVLIAKNVEGEDRIFITTFKRN